MGGFAAWCRRVTEDRRFTLAITLVIVLNAIVLGLETSRPLMERYGQVLKLIDHVFLAVFLVELVLRMAACWPRLLSFFRGGWNVFDFTIVLLSMLPIHGEFATVGRLVRLLRITRLVSMSPQLRLIVSTMLKSIPSIGHVAVLLGILLYIYGVAGVSLFRDAAPNHFGDMGAAMLTLFQLVTLEGWAEIQADVMEEHPWAWVYFSSFIVIAVFVVINLFIAIVIDNMNAAKAECGPSPLAAAAGGDRGHEDEVAQHVAALRRELDRLEARLSAKPQAAEGSAAGAGDQDTVGTGRATLRAAPVKA